MFRRLLQVFCLLPYLLNVVSSSTIEDIYDVGKKVVNKLIPCPRGSIKIFDEYCVEEQIVYAVSGVAVAVVILIILGVLKKLLC